MNLYITENSMHDSAHNLDNKRLPLQLNYAGQIISNVLRTNKEDYFYYLDRFSKDWSWTCKGDYETVLFPERLTSHEVVAWATRSPARLLFILKFYDSCFATLGDRRLVSSNQHTLLQRLTTTLSNYLQNIIPEGRSKNLLGLDKDLYRNLPNSLDKEETIIGYQKHLTAQWKQDIAKEIKYSKDVNKWVLDGKPIETKPRLVKALKWGRSYDAPNFAIEELTKYKERLINAS